MVANQWVLGAGPVQALGKVLKQLPRVANIVGCQNMCMNYETSDMRAKMILSRQEGATRTYLSFQIQ